MNNGVRAILARICVDGVPEPRRIYALLNDLAPAAVVERHILLAAAEEGVPRQLAIGRALPRLTQARLVQQLRERWGLDVVAAHWAVESWALVLGYAVDMPRKPPAVVYLARPPAALVREPLARPPSPPWWASFGLGGVGASLLAALAFVPLSVLSGPEPRLTPAPTATLALAATPGLVVRFATPTPLPAVATVMPQPSPVAGSDEATLDGRRYDRATWRWADGTPMDWGAILCVTAND